jgi:hypothetical protein
MLPKLSSHSQLIAVIVVEPVLVKVACRSTASVGRSDSGLGS